MSLEITMEQLETMHDTARKIALTRYYSGFNPVNYYEYQLILTQKPRTASKKILLKSLKESKEKNQREFESKMTTTEKEIIKSTTISIDDLPVQDRIPFLIYWHGRQKCELDSRYRFAKECIPLFYAILDEIIKRRDFE